MEESGGILEQQDGDAVVVENGSVPNHTQVPAVSVHDFTDTDKHIVHATIHKENEGLSNGTIVANGSCLKLPPPPDYEHVAGVTSNGDISGGLEVNNMSKLANGHVVKENGTIPDGSARAENVKDTAENSHTGAQENDRSVAVEDDELDDITPINSEKDSLEGEEPAEGVENPGYEPELPDPPLQDGGEEDVATFTRGSLIQVRNQNQDEEEEEHTGDYIKELMYP